MSVKIPNRYLVLAIIGAILATFFIGRCSTLAERDRVLNRLKEAENTISVMKGQLRDDSVIITSKEQEVLSQKEALKRLELDKRDLKALNIKQASELTNAKFRIDTLLQDVSHNGQIISLYVNMIDSLAKVKTPVKQNAIVLPFSFQKSDKWMQLRGSFDNLGKLSVALELIADVDIISGVDKTGKRKTTVTTNNPYISTIGISSFKVDEKKPTKWGIGVFGGYGVSLQKNPTLTPIIGFGLSRNIIRF